MRFAGSLAVPLLLLLFATSPARALVSCANPDELCTGDPCVVHSIRVESPCSVDFGDRALEIAGGFTVPPGGTLQLTAKSIVVRGRIRGRNAGGTGATIGLLATGGDVETQAWIDVSGGTAAGVITIAAAGNITVGNRMAARPIGSVSPPAGGSIVLDAGGTLTILRKGTIDVHGARRTSGGAADLRGAAGVTVGGVVDARGGAGGTVALASSGGVVTLDRKLLVSGTTAAGTATVSGAGGVVLNSRIRVVSEDGLPGSVDLESAGGDVVLVTVPLLKSLTGGALTVHAPQGTIVARKALALKTKGDGGAITMAAATLRIGHLGAVGKHGIGGTIQLSATSGLEITGKLDVRGREKGGAIALAADLTGDVIVSDKGKLIASSSGVGGDVVVAAPAGTVTIRADIDVSGKLGGGSLDVAAAATDVGPITIKAHGLSGGRLRFAQSGGGELRLEGKFDAGRSSSRVTGTGGTIAASAPTGNLTAIGRFDTTLGCIGLAAGGVLDTTQLEADVPLSPSCP